VNISQRTWRGNTGLGPAVAEQRQHTHCSGESAAPKLGATAGDMRRGPVWCQPQSAGTADSPDGGSASHCEGGRDSSVNGADCGTNTQRPLLPSRALSLASTSPSVEPQGPRADTSNATAPAFVSRSLWRRQIATMFLWCTRNRQTRKKHSR
jgi:hypothetical protein